MPEMAMDAGRLLERLAEANPWWESRRVPESRAPPYHRRDFYVLRGRLSQKPILALSGPRQVGKTTLMFQLISHLISTGVPPEHILYVTFDLPGLSLVSNDPLNDSVRVYEEQVLRTAFREAPGPIYLFLDEVTKVPTWHRDLKGWFDFGYGIRFVITSSSLAELQSGAAESLTGRISTHLLLTWKFVDVLCYRVGDRTTSEDYLDARGELRRAVRTGKPAPLVKTLYEIRPRTRKGRIALNTTLEWYLLVDGFPELLRSVDVSYCARRLDEYVKLTKAHDLYRFHQVRSSTRVFEDLLGLIANQSGGLFSYQNVAQALDLEVRTLSEYLDYLEGAFLISRAYFYTKNRVSRLRKQRKIYVSNPGFLNVLRGRLGPSLRKNSTELGFIAESVTHGYAKRMAFNLTLRPDPPVYYWRNRRDKEVDIVIEVDGVPLPIEVKYRENPKTGLVGLDDFAAEKRSPFSIVVTRDLLEADGNRLFIPLEDFMLLA